MTYKLSPQEARREWLKDLRSDEFEQGQGYLCSVDEAFPRHCALGVACETFLRCEGDLMDVMELDRKRCYDSKPCACPPKVREWLGLMDPLGASKYGTYFTCGESEYSSISGANDSHRTFDEIADAIESNVDLFFNQGAQ